MNNNIVKDCIAHETELLFEDLNKVILKYDDVEEYKDFIESLDSCIEIIKMKINNIIFSLQEELERHE